MRVHPINFAPRMARHKLASTPCYGLGTRQDGDVFPGREHVALELGLALLLVRWRANILWNFAWPTAPPTDTSTRSFVVGQCLLLIGRCLLLIGRTRATPIHGIRDNHADIAM